LVVAQFEKAACTSTRGVIPKARVFSSGARDLKRNRPQRVSQAEQPMFFFLVYFVCFTVCFRLEAI
jgi:hypothetical protein